MATDVVNYLVVEGDSEGIDRFWEKCMTNGRLDFEKVIPPPINLFKGSIDDEIRAYYSDRGIPIWMEWNTRNWGTKWNAYDQSISYDGDALSISYKTANYGASEIIKAIVTAFPRLTFTHTYYREWGNYYSRDKYENGVAVEFWGSHITLNGFISEVEGLGYCRRHDQVIRGNECEECGGFKNE